MNRIHITGATGFLGSFLLKSLMSKYIITCSSYSKKLNEIKKIDHINFDLANKENIPDTFLDDTDIVIHCAGAAHKKKFQSKNMSDSFKRNNENATRNVIDFVIRKSVKKFIYISSLSVYNTNNFNVKINKFSKCDPSNDYGVSKLAAETFIKSTCDRNKIDYIIIRPALILSESSPGNIKKLVNYLSTGLPFIGCNEKNLRSYISLSSLCKLIEHCIEKKEITNNFFIAADKYPISTNDLISILQNRSKRKSFIIKMPKIILKLFFYFIRSKEFYNKLYGNMVVDSSETEKYFNWDNQYPSIKSN